MNFLKRLFRLKSPKSGIVFIVEDNSVYAMALEAFIKSNFPGIKEVCLFPVGETCLMELHKNPDVIIVDYFLDGKYYDAETGLELIREIRGERPETDIIVLSSQKEIDVVIELVQTYKCRYVKKDTHAFEKVREIIRVI